MKKLTSEELKSAEKSAYLASCIALIISIMVVVLMVL